MPCLPQDPLAGCCSTLWGGPQPAKLAVFMSHAFLHRCQDGIGHDAPLVCAPRVMDTQARPPSRHRNERLLPEA